MTQRLPLSSFPPTGSEPPLEVTDNRETEKAFSAPAPAERDRASLTLMTGPDAGRVFGLDQG